MKLLKFGAAWCGSCKTLAKKMETARLGDIVEVVDIDIEEQGDVADDYGVRNLPTLILVTEGGEVICRWTGLNKDLVETVKEKINNLKLNGHGE